MPQICFESMCKMVENQKPDRKYLTKDLGYVRRTFNKVLMWYSETYPSKDTSPNGFICSIDKVVFPSTKEYLQCALTLYQAGEIELSQEALINIGDKLSPLVSMTRSIVGNSELEDTVTAYQLTKATDRIIKAGDLYLGEKLKDARKGLGGITVPYSKDCIAIAKDFYEYAMTEEEATNRVCRTIDNIFEEGLQFLTKVLSGEIEPSCKQQLFIVSGIGIMKEAIGYYEQLDKKDKVKNAENQLDILFQQLN